MSHSEDVHAALLFSRLAAPIHSSFSGRRSAIETTAETDPTDRCSRAAVRYNEEPATVDNWIIRSSARGLFGDIYLIYHCVNADGRTIELVVYECIADLRPKATENNGANDSFLLTLDDATN